MICDLAGRLAELRYEAEAMFTIVHPMGDTQ
jgi:hypothetical protein